MTTNRLNDIAARVKLCSLNTGAWRATKLHKKESDIVNKAHHATDIAKVHVKLTSSPALHELNKLHAAAYDTHKRLTLPSIQEGLRLLPAGREFEHSAKMKEFADKHRALKAQFVAEYDADKASAPARLNGLFDPAHWPAVAEVSARFTFNTRYLPCPVDGAWKDWFNESAAAAEGELRERLTSALEHLKKVCSGDGKLYQSVFSNLAEVIELAPDLNFSDVPEIAEVAKLATELGKLDADDVRDDTDARRAAADKASKLLGLFGGAQ